MRRSAPSLADPTSRLADRDTKIEPGLEFRIPYMAGSRVHSQVRDIRRECGYPEPRANIRWKYYLMYSL